MKTISVFNNKGGVGKTTLTFHLAHALAELGHRTLLIDLDPQCNLTIYGMGEDSLHDIWKVEDDFVSDFKAAQEKLTQEEFAQLIAETRSIHFLLKPVEDGVADLPSLPPPCALANNLDLIPGRLTMHLFEDAISRRWSEVYQGEPLALRTVTKPTVAPGGMVTPATLTPQRHPTIRHSISSTPRLPAPLPPASPALTPSCPAAVGRTGR